jgi:hypothetical protein
MALIAAGPVSARAAQVIDRVLAVVSGTVIMLSDARAAMTLGLFDAGTAADPVGAAMRWLIDRQLVLDEAARGDRVDVDPDQLREVLDRTRRRFPSEDEYRRALDGLGLDNHRLSRLVRDTLTARLYVERRFDSMPAASEEELRAYYANHAGRFVRNGRQLAYEQVQAEVAAVVLQERREQAVEAWLDRLRRRADIRVVHVGPDRR